MSEQHPSDNPKATLWRVADALFSVMQEEATTAKRSAGLAGAAGDVAQRLANISTAGKMLIDLCSMKIAMEKEITNAVDLALINERMQNGASIGEALGDPSAVATPA